MRPLPLFGRLRHGTTRERRAEVIKAPADYNRAARREVGVLGRAWAWDARALGTPRYAQRPPRYARRHFAPGILTEPKTRRQRKQKARILRAMAGRA